MYNIRRAFLAHKRRTASLALVVATLLATLVSAHADTSSPTYTQPFDLTSMATSITGWIQSTFTVVLPIAGLFIGGRWIMKAFKIFGR